MKVAMAAIIALVCHSVGLAATPAATISVEAKLDESATATADEVVIAVCVSCREGSHTFLLGGDAQVFGIYVLGPWGSVQPDLTKVRPENWMHQQHSAARPINITPDQPFKVKLRLANYFPVNDRTAFRPGPYQVNVKFYAAGLKMTCPADSGAIHFDLAEIAGPAEADEQAQGRAIIDKAIEFFGGREALARYKKPFVRHSEATVIRRDGATVVKSKQTILFPNKARDEQTTDRGTTLVVFNGDKGKGWSTRSLNPRTIQEMREPGMRLSSDNLYQGWVCTLLPLDDPAFRLLRLGDATVIDGRPAVGVQVSHVDRPNIRLYFDKETYALLKSSRQLLNGTEQEFFQDYDDLDGLKHAKSVSTYQNGNKILVRQTTELEFLDSIQEEAFEKP